MIYKRVNKSKVHREKTKILEVDGSGKIINTEQPRSIFMSNWDSQRIQQTIRILEYNHKSNRTANHVA